MLAVVARVVLPFARPCGRRGIIINNHNQTARQMRVQIDALGRYFTFVDHEGMVRALGSRGRGKPFCLLTFDDGKRVNILEAAPELRRRGVPAVFYVVSDAAGRGTPLWIDLANALEENVEGLPAELRVATLKELPHDEAVRRVTAACACYQISPDQADPAVQPMSWDEIRSLHAQGFTIGAHGRRHGILTEMPEEAARDEIRESTRAVSEALGAPCPSFAFPNGNGTERLARYALECGVTTVMTTEPRWVGASARPAWLPRVQLYAKYDAGRVIAKVLAALPGLFLRDPGRPRPEKF